MVYCNDSYVRSFVFCATCGGKLVPETANPTHLECSKCRRVTYVNPKVGVALLITRYHHVLLAQRAYEPYAGSWVLPAGYVDYGETCEEAAVREAKEELGTDVVLSSLHGVYSYGDDPRSYMVLVIYRAVCDIEAVTPADDISHAQLFHVSALPSNIAFQGIRDALEAWKREISGRSPAI